MIASGFLKALEGTKFAFGGAPPGTPLGKLTALPRLPGWFKGGTCETGSGSRGERRERERERRRGKKRDP